MRGRLVEKCVQITVCILLLSYLARWLTAEDGRVSCELVWTFGRIRRNESYWNCKSEKRRLRKLRQLRRMKCVRAGVV